MAVTTIEIRQEVEQGLDYLLSHFSSPSPSPELDIPLFPRTISTELTEGRQVLVSSKREALELFAQSSYVDCRISAYPYWRPSKVSNFIGMRNCIAPNFIMIDLDKGNFKSIRALKRGLSTVLKSIESKIYGHPTVLWSGGGYHIYQPMDAIILENYNEFNETEEPSREFLRFTETYLSDGKSDKFHNGTVSLNNLLTRVPGSINSKNGEQVKIVKRWDGLRPRCNLVMGSFCAYLADQQIKKQLELQEKYNFTNSSNTGDPYIIDWIERLLQTPMTDHRKIAVWMILPQYLVNVRKLSAAESHTIIQKWLDKCNELKRLDRAATKQKLKAGFNTAEKGFKPIGIEKLKNWKPELAALLFN